MRRTSAVATTAARRRRATAAAAHRAYRTASVSGAARTTTGAATASAGADRAGRRQRPPHDDPPAHPRVDRAVVRIDADAVEDVAGAAARLGVVPDANARTRARRDYVQLLADVLPDDDLTDLDDGGRGLEAVLVDVDGDGGDQLGLRGRPEQLAVRLVRELAGAEQDTSHRGDHHEPCRPQHRAPNLLARQRMRERRHAGLAVEARCDFGDLALLAGFDLQLLAQRCQLAGALTTQRGEPALLELAQSRRAAQGRLVGQLGAALGLAVLAQCLLLGAPRGGQAGGLDARQLELARTFARLGKDLGAELDGAEGGNAEQR